MPLGAAYRRFSVCSAVRRARAAAMVAAPASPSWFSLQRVEKLWRVREWGEGDAVDVGMNVGECGCVRKGIR